MRLWWIAFFWPLIAGAVEPIKVAPASPPPHTKRIADAARLWSRLQWVHPALADDRIDWDRALLDALPAIAAADTDAAKVEALRLLIAPLNDEAALVGVAPAPVYVKVLEGSPTTQMLADGILLVNLHRLPSPFDVEFANNVAAIQQAMEPARAVIIDLRPAAASWFGPADVVNRLVPELIVRALSEPAVRGRMHQGYRPQTGISSGGYFSAWMTQAAQVLVPSATARLRPMAFIINSATILPPSVLALQKSGLAYVVAEGHPDLSWVAPVQELEVSGTAVRFAAGELVFEDGMTGFGADRVLPVSTDTGPSSAAVRSAVALLAGVFRPGIEIAWRSLAPLARWVPDRRYPEPALPSPARRQLAVIRLWSVIDNFFPYKALLDEPWDAALPEFLARMDEVTDARDYALVLAEMAARLHDNHVRLVGVSFDRALGEAALPLRMDVVEGRVVVSELLDRTAARGVMLWDEILSIDGEPVDTARARLERVISWANDGTRALNPVRRALGRGSDGSVAVLKVRGADGAIVERSLIRSTAHAKPMPQRRGGDEVRILAGGIGYVDLDRLKTAQVDAMFEQLKDTRAIVFDMRGYPNGTAWSIAPRLNVKGATLGPIFEPPLLQAGMAWDEPGLGRWVQTLPPGDGKPLYRGRVVMLIDARTQSQAEHTGLFFEAACDLTYVGSPSAGSNGDVTRMVLPGALELSFSGQGVRRPDGRQLQRTGLQPHLATSPTLAGLRAGHDEVLERAISFLETGR